MFLGREGGVFFGERGACFGRGEERRVSGCVCVCFWREGGGVSGVCFREEGVFQGGGVSGERRVFREGVLREGDSERGRGVFFGREEGGFFLGVFSGRRGRGERRGVFGRVFSGGVFGGSGSSGVQGSRFR